MDTPRPLVSEDGEIVQFATREEFEAWTRAEVENPDDFLRGCEESRVQWEAWEAAGRPGDLPPGWVRHADYLRERGA